MRIAVAGVSGFIGRHVARALSRAGHEVVGLSRRPPPTAADVAHHIAIDLVTDRIDPEVLRGCDAVVNLVGIAEPDRTNTFTATHIDVVQRLGQAAKDAGIGHLVHVSVAAIGSASDYHRTKSAGEDAARALDLRVTILRPGLVYGRGDQMLRNIVQLTRVSPVFVAPSPTGPLSVVDVRDVAGAICRAALRPAGEADELAPSYDLVGPEALDLPSLVRRVAGALGQRVAVLRLPAALMGVAAPVLRRVFPAAPTPAQLAMLVHGLDGDSTAARRDLGFSPRPLRPQRIRSLAARVPDLAPSIRLSPGPEHRKWLDGYATGLVPWLAFVVVAIALMVVTPRWLGDVWSRMAIVDGLLVLLATALLRPAWAPLWRVRAWMVPVALVGAIALYGLGLAGSAMLTAAWPDAAQQVASVTAWGTAWPLGVAIPSLVLIVVAEDAVWRAAITLPLASGVGPGKAALVSAIIFGVAHVESGPPVLWLAAIGMGFAWNLLLIRTRSLLAVSGCHLLWDLAVLFVFPY